MRKSLRYSYLAYGLGIRSFVPLSDLVESDLYDDVTVKQGRVIGSKAFKALPVTKVFERAGFRSTVSTEGVVLELAKVGAFFIRNGTDVLVEPEPGVLIEDLQPFLTGPIMAFLLHQRGLMVLHSSSVIINGSAVAFLGNKGYGKSTLAASMCVRGHKLVSDDLVPVRFENGRVFTAPGFPKIKLYEDSIEAVGANPSDFPLIHRFVQKRSFRCIDRFSIEPVKLDCIFVLTVADDFGIRELGKVPAFVEITRHTHLNHYLEALNCQAEHFTQCQRLLDAVPVFELRRPHQFEQMDRVIDMVEDHMANLKTI